MFRELYSNVSFFRALFQDSSIPEFLLIALLPVCFGGILVQIATILTFSRIINVSYQDWRTMLQTLYINAVNNKLPQTTPEQLLYVLFYAVYSVALAAMLGFLLYKVVRWFGLDLKIPAFRFLNQWHYYFKGEILRTPEFKMSHRGKVISTEVDLMLKDDNGKSNLFSGFHQNILTEF